jgi:hypothetical protein
LVIKGIEAATKDTLSCLPDGELSRKPDGVPVSAIASDRAETAIALG